MSAIAGSRVRSAVAAYFLVSAAVNLVMVLGFGDLYRRYFALRYRQGTAGGVALGDSVDGAMTLLVAVTLLTAAVLVALSMVTLLRPRRWLLLVDAVALLAAGGPTVVGRLIEVFSPNNAVLPPVFGQTQLVLSVVAVLLAGAIGLDLRAAPHAGDPVGQS